MQGKIIRGEDHVVLTVVGISKPPHREKADKESVKKVSFIPFRVTVDWSDFSDSKKAWSTSYTWSYCCSSYIGLTIDSFVKQNLTELFLHVLVIIEFNFVLFYLQRRIEVPQHRPHPLPIPLPAPLLHPPLVSLLQRGIQVASLPIFTFILVLKGFCHKINTFLKVYDN